MSVTPTSLDPPARHTMIADNENRPVIDAADVPDFDRIVREHHEPVRRLVRRLTGWSADSEDVVQDVFTVVLEQLPKFRGDSSLGTWITGIAIRTCRQHQRRWRRAWRALRDPRLAPPRAGGAMDPDAGMEAEETGLLVREAVRALRPADREVIVLYYMQEIPVRQVAQILGLKPGAVEVRLHRARRRLGEKLRPKGLGDQDLVWPRRNASRRHRS